MRIGFVKKVLKRVTREKEDNLIRLRFDLMYANKLYNREAIQEIDRKLIALRNDVTTEKNKRFKERDKELIIRNEAEISKLEGQMREYQQLSKQIVRTLELIPQTENVIEVLKKVVKNRQELKEITYGRTKNYSPEPSKNGSKPNTI